MTIAGPPDGPADSASDGFGRAVARNTAWTVGARLIILLAWAGVTPFILEALGSERFAIWALLFTLSAAFATFDLGLSHSLVRFIAEAEATRDAPRLRALVSLGLLAFGGIGLVGVTGLWLLREPLLGLVRTPAALRPEAGVALVAMAFTLGLQNLAGVATAVLNGHQRMDVTNRISLIGTAVQFAGVALVLGWGGGLPALVAATAAGVVTSGLLSVRAVRRIAPGLAPSMTGWRGVGLRPLLGYSAALQVTLAGFMMQSQLDKLLLANLVSLAAVTPFELAARLSGAMWAVPMLMLPPLVPAFARLSTLGDAARERALYHRASRYLAALAFPLAALGLAAAPALVTLWLGPGHPEAALGVRGMAVFMMLTTLTGICTAALRGAAEPWPEARYHLLGFGLHLALSLWLVPRHGLAGALAAMTVSAGLAGGWLLAGFHRRRGDPVARWLASDFARPALLSGLALALALGVAVWLGDGAGSRGAALRSLAVTGAVFAAVLVPGYILAGVVAVDELRELVHGALSRTPNPPR